MLENFKKLQERETKNIPTNLTFPLLRWSSGNPENLRVCNKLNKLFFYCKPKIILDLLSLGIKSADYIKYPKRKKNNIQKTEILQEIFNKKYGWSKREFNLYDNLVDSEDIESLATQMGMNNKKRKILGLETIKSIEKPKKQNKTLFEY